MSPTFEWDGMRVRYSFQVALALPAQPLQSTINSGVNLDKCLVQGLSPDGKPDAVMRNTSRNREAVERFNQKNESKSSGHLFAY